MFGYVLVSNKNDVISFGGNERFDEYLHERLRSEILFSSDAPSTSSGVYTDSSMESLCTDEKTDEKPDEKPSVSRGIHPVKDSLPLSKQEVTHLFLPIISTFRSQKTIRCDSIYSMTSDEVMILFRRLRSNYLMVSVGNSEKLQQQFLDYVELGLEVNVGPLIGLLDTDPSSVTLGWNFLKSLVEKRSITDDTKVKGFIDIGRAIFFHSELSVSLPLLNALSLHLQDTIGDNRCLLLGNGDVLSSISSGEDENHLCKSIAISDLNFLLKQISHKEFNRSDEIFQVWLRSTKSIVPYLVDVMISNIGDGFKIVCIFEAKYNTLIRTITVFLVQMDRIQYSDDVMKETREIEKTVESIAQQLLAFSSSNPSRRSAGGGFLKNPERTAYFIESLWQRTEDLLLASSGCYTIDPERPRSFTNISLGSLRSAMSSGSLASSTLSHPGAKKFRSTLKCDVTMEYFRRQAVSILQELCFESHRLTAPQKLAQFRKVVSRVIDPRDGSIWSYMQRAMASEDSSAQLRTFMCPLGLGLDMLAYSVTIPTKSVSVTYTPEWIRDEFDSPTKFPSSSGIVALLGKSGKRYNLIKIRAQQKQPTSWMSVFKSVRTYVNGTSLNDEGEYAYAVALFEEGINNELAEREVLKLIEIVTSRMYTTCSFIY